MMNKKRILPVIFLSGVAFGVVASEMASNGLYIFKSGDPIVAAEVNSNFEMLYKKTKENEAKSIVVGQWFSCTGDDGSTYKNIHLWHNNHIETNTLWPENGPGAIWSYDPITELFSLDSTPAMNINIFVKSGDSQYEIRIEPQDQTLEKFSCYRS